MNWIHTNINGKACFVLGALALLFVLAPILASELNDNKPGLVSYIGSNVVSALTPKGEPTVQPTMKAGGFLPFSEKEEKELLGIVSVCLAFISLVLSLLSERAKEFSLYYAGGVLASLNALLIFSIPVALILVAPTIIGLWYLRRENKKPNQSNHRTTFSPAVPPKK
jgi:hypothetical protein